MKGYHNQGKDVRVALLHGTGSPAVVAAAAVSAEHQTGGGATRYHQIPSECWVIIIRPPTPWGRLLYSSLPALPPRLSKVDVALHSTVLLVAAVLKILSTNDAQPLITKVALKMILEL